MPMAKAVVSVPPSQTASVEPDTPAAVMLAATATPVAEASAVIAPSLWIKSEPAPEARPVARAVAVEVLAARETPCAVTEMLAPTVSASLLALTSPLLMIV
jgi:hypothetical protein